MGTIVKWIRDWFTEEDGASCPIRISGVAAIIVMTVKMAVLPAPDFQNFGLGVAAIVTVLVGNKYIELKKEKGGDNV